MHDNIYSFLACGQAEKDKMHQWNKMDQINGKNMNINKLIKQWIVDKLASNH